MKRMGFCVSLAISIVLSLPLSLAQQSPQTAASILVPRLIRFSGAVNDDPGQLRRGVVGITFALYKDQAGGAALWLETQNVSLDAQGRYTVLLGANSAEGMPVELFTANEARWLGVQPEGQAEQRVLLVSVPYALKAADAETLGGRPASSFVLAAPAANSGSGSSGSQTGGNTGTNSAGSSANGISPNATCTSGSCPVSTSAPGGTANFLPLFTDATTVQDSTLSQSPCPGNPAQTCVGIGNSSATRTLDVNGEIVVEGGNIFMQRNLTDFPGRRNWAWGTETFNVGDVSLFVSASNTALPSLPVFTALSNGFMGIGVPTPHANLEIAGSAGGGLLVDSPGVITGSGAGLTNLPAASLTGSLPAASLSGVNGSGLTTLNAASLTGTLPSATLAGVNGSGLTNVNAAMLGGILPGAFATTGANSFVGDQTITGNVKIVGVGNNLTVGGAITVNQDPGATGIQINGIGGTDVLTAQVGSVTIDRVDSAGNHTVTGTSTAIGGFTAPALGTANATAGFPSAPLVVSTSVYNPTTGPFTNTWSLGAEPMGNDTPTASSFFDIFVDVGMGPKDTGIHFLPDGTFTAPKANFGVIGPDVAAGVTAPLFTPGANFGFVYISGTAGNLLTVQGTGSMPALTVAANSTATFNGPVFYGGDVTAEGMMTVHDLLVTNSLSKPAGSFKIDHPLDPEHKILYHSFVESPDMKNVYDGVATLDANGRAWVELPDYFEALNRDFRYQLTCIGGYAPVYIAEEISRNRFRIAGGKPGLKVSWQVTGTRQDAFAEKHRIQVEEEKPAAEQGFYLYPEAYGQPEEKGVAWARSHPAKPKAPQAEGALETPVGPVVAQKGE